MTIDADPSPKQFPDLPEHFDLPELSSLSPEQQAAINDGPGWVHGHVDVEQFDSVEAFRPHVGMPGNERGCGNFVALLGQQGIYEYIADHTPAVQRYLILFPDQAEELRGKVTELSEYLLPEDTLEQAFRAYKIMAKLIDPTDDYVSGDPNEDRFYLTR